MVLGLPYDHAGSVVARAVGVVLRAGREDFDLAYPYEPSFICYWEASVPHTMHDPLARH